MHFSSTSAFALAGLLAAPAAAMWDPAGCSGMGACTSPAGCNYFPNLYPQEAEWDCGSAGKIIGQIGAGSELNFEKGFSAEGMEIVAAKDFPKCNLMQPPTEPGKATLLKTVYQGITTYGWIEYTCTEKTPIKDACYNGTKNGSKTWTCQVYKGGQQCTHINKDLNDKRECPRPK